MRRALILGSALVWLAAPLPAEETRFPAVLAGHAVLPALTLVPPPPDAPRDALVSGKFATAVRGVRNDRPLSFEGDTFGFHGSRGTSLFLPFIGQPVQGFSGFAMDPAPDGSVYAIIDNGFGSRISSPDALLSFARLAPDFATGAVDVVEQVWLRDPNRVVPFRLAYEGTEARYLTGADFDPESLQVIGEEVWIGDEFGPYLISAALDGVVTGVHEARMDGAALRSPDHPALRIPAPAGTAWRVPRSGGFEGLALQPGTGLLWAVLERPMLDETGAPEGRFLRATAFDPVARAWTGESLRIALSDGAVALGDVNFIDETRALMIERDGGEGDPSLRCEGPPRPDCFPNPAVIKRVVLIDEADRDADGAARRIGHIDLMDIADPDGLARLATDAARDLTGRFTMPFTTIESVRRVDDAHILVAVDNNLPFSTGRRLDRALDNEFVLLRVPELLSAR